MSIGKGTSKNIGSGGGSGDENYNKNREGYGYGDRDVFARVVSVEVIAAPAVTMIIIIIND